MQRLYEEKEEEEDEERTIGARMAASRAPREDRKEDCNEGANGVKECGGKRRKEEEEKKKKLKDPSATSTIHLLKFPSAQCVSPVRSVEILHPNVEASS